MMPTLSSPSSTIITAYGTTSYDKVGIMITVGFHTETYHYINFVATGGIVGCHNWIWIWIDTFRFSKYIETCL